MYTKEEIIKEIQKFAKENGGKTPSEKELDVNTGIKNYYWHKYWSKISDAQIEAGLLPNIFPKIPYEHKDLFEKFITLMRELKKWPTKAEIEVKHNKEYGFPGSSIFYRNLGNIKDLANKILQYAEDNNYDDVIKICSEVLEKYKNVDISEKDGSEKGAVTSGFVYLGIQHGDHKIGHAKDANRRREDITLLGSEPFVLIHEIKTDDMNGVEKYWHTRFKSKWLRGEWFNLSSSDVKAFKHWKRII